MDARRRWPLRLLAAVWVAAALLLFALMPVWMGLPLWLAIVVAGWVYRRQGLEVAAGRCTSLAQTGLFGLAVEIGRSVGHGAVGVLCGLLSVLLMVNLLAVVFPRPRSPVADEAQLPDWNPHAPIGPGGGSYVLPLAASPATSPGAPRQIPGMDDASSCWLWPGGWLLPADVRTPEQDAADRYAVLAGQRAGVNGVWLLQLATARAYWLRHRQLAGWRDGRPWFEPLGGGRLLSMEDCLVANDAVPVVRRGALLDLDGMLPEWPVPPVVHDAGPDMPQLALQAEWPADSIVSVDPLAPLRQPRFSLWMAHRDTGLRIEAGTPDALRWHASTGRLWILAVDPEGQSQHWVWHASTGLRRPSPAEREGRP
ncbi:hypothetical protein ACYJW8_12360 [Frateuria aurantia]